MSKYLISDLIYQFFHSYEKKKFKAFCKKKKRSLDISLQHKNEASYKFSKKKFCTWPKTGLDAERVEMDMSCIYFRSLDEVTCMVVGRWENSYFVVIIFR